MCIIIVLCQVFQVVYYLLQSLVKGIGLFQLKDLQFDFSPV